MLRQSWISHGAAGLPSVVSNVSLVRRDYRHGSHGKALVGWGLLLHIAFLTDRNLLFSCTETSAPLVPAQRWADDSRNGFQPPTWLPGEALPGAARDVGHY